MKKLFFFLFAALFISCESGKRSKIDMAERSVAEKETALTDRPSSPGTADLLNAPEQSKIIREGYIFMEVKDYPLAVDQARQVLKRWKGYILKENEQTTDYQVQDELIMRVPAASFDSLVNDVLKLAWKVTNKSIEAKDVTEEYVDIEARLRSKREVEKRYIDLLQEAKNVNDILKVEEQLRVIREEIEAREGRLKYIQNQADYSTLNLTVTKKLSTRTTIDFFFRIGEALKGGWRGLLGFIIAFVYIWPFILIIGVTLYLILRRNRKNKAGNSTPLQGH